MAEPGTEQGRTADRIDRWFLGPEVVDCADTAADELRRSGDLEKAVKEGLVDCAREVAAAWCRRSRS